MSTLDVRTRHIAHPSHRPTSNDVPACANEPRLLIVSEREDTCRQLQAAFSGQPGLEIEVAADFSNAIQLIETGECDVVAVELRKSDIGGDKFVVELRRRGLLGSSIVITSAQNGDAEQSVFAGAADFVTAPLDAGRLRCALQRVLRERLLRLELAQLREQLHRPPTSQAVLGKNPQMQTIREKIEHLAQTSTPVLIVGEPASGKGQIARALHAAGEFSAGSLKVVNCGMLPEPLLESELFGYEFGSREAPNYEGNGIEESPLQTAHRTGTLEGGSLYLMEIGALSGGMQTKLLRLMEESGSQRSANPESGSVGIRLIASTTESLLSLVREGRFRQDLWERLAAVKIEVPPLRERPEDIPQLVNHFLQQYAGPNGPKQVSPEAMELLLRHRWPGNLRELDNAIERACITARDAQIRPENLPPALSATESTRTLSRIDLSRPLRELLRESVASLERRYIRKALKKAHGNVGRCARICGLSRRSVSSKIAEYKLDKAAFKDL